MNNAYYHCCYCAPYAKGPPKLRGPDILTAGNTVLISDPLFHWLDPFFSCVHWASCP